MRRHYASVGTLMAYILSILVVLLLYSTEDKAPSAPPGCPVRPPVLLPR